MVEFRPVTAAHVLPLIDLNVSSSQEDFVAPNAVTLAEAAYKPASEVFGIWQGTAPVGMMAMIDLSAVEEEDEADRTSAYLWRLMVAQQHQGHGIGRAAFDHFRDWAKARGLTRLIVSVVPENRAALRIYEANGLRPTGRVDDGEVELAGPA